MNLNEISSDIDPDLRTVRQGLVAKWISAGFLLSGSTQDNLLWTHLQPKGRQQRNRLIRTATPIWANKDAIKQFYVEARRLSLLTGIAHHVDHIVPLMGRTAMGLHCEQNLRVIRASENLKRKRIWSDPDIQEQPLPSEWDLTRVLAG